VGKPTADPINEGAIHPHGFWISPHPDGELWDRALALFLAGFFQNKTVMDFGCGRGQYIESWRAAGIDVDGVEGLPLIETFGLNYQCADLAEPLGLGRLYDWGFCLEVGEHIPAEYQDCFLGNITNFVRDGIVLSWAIPGQPGHGHVNCRPNEWVIEQMGARIFRVDKLLTGFLRQVVQLPYLHKTLFVFRKDGPE